MTLYTYGDKYLSNQNLTDGIWCVDSLSRDLGFKTGDKILLIEGEPVERFSSIVEKMLSAKTITVERDGSDLDISLPDNFIEKLIENDGSMLFYPRIPAIVSSFLEKSNAEQAGLKVNDQIIGVNDKEIKYNDEMAKALSGLKDSTANILVKRGEEELTLKSKVSSDGTIGYYPALLSFNQFEEFGVYKLNSETYNLINLQMKLLAIIGASNYFLVYFKMGRRS